MERKVFVSHAANDPAWTPARIEAVATAIQQAGIGVDLDLWHQRDAKRHLSLSEWQEWMDAAIEGATHILCLVSPHYLTLWGRRPDIPGGLGVAFESIRLVHGLYLLKQRNHGRILTLRTDDSGFDCIPPHLAPDCPHYQWTNDREMLLSHVAHAEIPRQVSVTPRPPWARVCGEDNYGRWADLTVNGVTQRMRWMKPTGPEGFWMGSPQTERDAIENGDARDWANQREQEPRQVVITEGFWLADTPCTQAFWQAVTGKNPSHYCDKPDAPERPVEKVSWDDLMNEFVHRFASTPEWGAGNRLSLPTESQWEYAVRAGTRTPYWWGVGAEHLALLCGALRTPGCVVWGVEYTWLCCVGR